MITVLQNEETINKETAVCIGKFDGVHLGHKEMIERCVKDKEKGLAPTVFTFEDNPKKYLEYKDVPRRLADKTNNIKRLENIGIEYIVLEDFRRVMNMSPKEFIDEVLIKKLKTKKVFCGEDFRFGRDAKGDAQTLKAMCKEKEIEVEIVPTTLYQNKKISSERIRQLLLDGNIELANELLGRPFQYNYVVQHGNKLGRKIGIPTINQVFPKGYLMPKRGVYASYVELDNKEYYAVTNIGIKPTIGGEKPIAETWIPQYSLGLLYGYKVNVFLTNYLREEKKFDSLSELKKAIEQDAKKSKDIYSKRCENNA